jgi:hypothetical protein
MSRSGRFKNSSPNLCLAWLFAGGNSGVDRAANDTRVDFLGIANDARFVNVFAGEADVCRRGRRKVVLVWNDFRAPGLLTNFAPFLRRIVFVSKSPLRLRFDFKRVGLRTVGGGDQFIVGRASLPVALPD